MLSISPMSRSSMLRSPVFRSSTAPPREIATAFRVRRDAGRFRSAVLTGAAVAAAGMIGAGTATAAPLLVDNPVPAPGIPAQAPPPPPVPAPAAPDMNVGAANSFLQTLNGMLNNFVPGAGSIIPNDVSTLAPPPAASPAPSGATPATPGVPGAPGAPAPAKGTIAGSTAPGETAGSTQPAQPSGTEAPASARPDTAMPDTAQPGSPGALR